MRARQTRASTASGAARTSTADEVAERLLALNREHARHEHGHAATRTLNLLVAPGEDVAPDTARGAARAALARLAIRRARSSCASTPRRGSTRPSRSTARSAGRRAAPATATTSALLVADAERLAHADSLVRRCASPGLPTVLWLPGTRASRAQDRRSRRSHRRSCSTPARRSGAALPAAFARAAALDVARVRDVAWLRLARWRRHVAARFDDPDALCAARSRRARRAALVRAAAGERAAAGRLDRRARRLDDRASDAGGRTAGAGRARRRGRRQPSTIALAPPSDAGPHRHPRARAARRRRRRSRCARRSRHRTRRARSPRRWGCSTRRRPATRPRSPHCSTGCRGDLMIDADRRRTTPRPPRARAPSGSRPRSRRRAPSAASRTSRLRAAARRRARTSCWRELVADWRDVHLWFGDERCVPLDDPDSNHLLVRRTLLDAAAGARPPRPIVHAVDARRRRRPGGGRRGLRARAARDALPERPLPAPALDLALLGLGEDGHTASLFPDDAALEERERLCVAVHGRKPPFERVTLTLPMLRAARADRRADGGRGQGVGGRRDARRTQPARAREPARRGRRRSS